ncbi:CaiB/BaiF CoA transferase family protein [Gordonia alkanivorans]|uniref:CaiB/BaiF CoA transferase family protein n=1 Tax=Gordonia alkanivorans TaxID=84096 RepID=UPI00244BC636|nr:CaiB/BaiF CoA-transferase family protein [Gordonia alkanivorans]MDH3047268.1 CaiB/BaiF CoA-transferase family protein [Gordonia alkanivorans]
MGPGPHAAMILGDLGADVVRVQRPGGLPVDGVVADAQLRARTTVEADLKNASDLAEVLELCSRADVLIEGFRPGVAERLGIGPEVVASENPGLVYGRMTGWGQQGPRAHQAGHDINYVGLTGLLHAMGPSDGPPLPPLNLFGDFGGGSMFLVVGILSALLERTRSGRGQVVDAAIVNGSATLGHLIWSMRGRDRWSDARGTNVFDGSAPFYRTYECADGRYMAVGALEPQFFAALLRTLELSSEDVGAQRDSSDYPRMHKLLEKRFLERTRDEWTAVFADVDACVTPVLSLDEAPADPQLAARGTFTVIDGVIAPAPSPSFSRTPSPTPSPPPRSATAIETIWV